MSGWATLGSLLQCGEGAKLIVFVTGSHLLFLWSLGQADWQVKPRTGSAPSAYSTYTPSYTMFHYLGVIYSMPMFKMTVQARVRICVCVCLSSFKIWCSAELRSSFPGNKFMRFLCILFYWNFLTLFKKILIFLLEQLLTKQQLPRSSWQIRLNTGKSWPKELRCSPFFPTLYLQSKAFGFSLSGAFMQSPSAFTSLL